MPNNAKLFDKIKTKKEFSNNVNLTKQKSTLKILTEPGLSQTRSVVPGNESTHSLAWLLSHGSPPPPSA